MNKFKNFILKNKFILLLLFIILALLTSIFYISFGMEDFEDVDFNLGIVNTDYLNLRTGPGKNFESICILKRNEYLRIYAKIGDWYLVQNQKDNIGCVHSKYINKTSEEKTATTSTEIINENENVNLNLTTDEKELISLINAERKKNNIPELTVDENLQNVARLKAKDLVDNNYFSHISPTYGTPFEMLKTNNISYKTASENIAGNSSIEGAISSWMNSNDHKKNILSNDYNYTGIAVVDSIAYGKIIVELFIGK